MKLLLILPNLILIAVAGINLSNELSVAQLHKNLSVIVLHFSVLLMCLVFVSLILRSMYADFTKSKRIYPGNEGSEYEKMQLDRTIRL